MGALSAALVPPVKPGKVADLDAFNTQADLAALLSASDSPLRLLKMAILGGLQLATTASIEGASGLWTTLHTQEEPRSHAACSQWPG